MKQIAILLLITALTGTSCMAQRNKVAYDFPAAMSDAVRADYQKQCDKGKVLYELNCAECHNTKVRRRTVIPDFTQEKLIGYALRVSNPKHESNMPDTKVTTEELGLIMTFLTYKVKNKYREIFLLQSLNNSVT